MVRDGEGQLEHNTRLSYTPVGSVCCSPPKQSASGHSRGLRMAGWLKPLANVRCSSVVRMSVPARASLLANKNMLKTTEEDWDIIPTAFTTCSRRSEHICPRSLGAECIPTSFHAGSTVFSHSPRVRTCPIFPYLRHGIQPHSHRLHTRKLHDRHVHETGQHAVGTVAFVTFPRLYCRCRWVSLNFCPRQLQFNTRLSVCSCYAWCSCA